MTNLNARQVVVLLKLVAALVDLLMRGYWVGETKKNCRTSDRITWLWSISAHLSSGLGGSVSMAAARLARIFARSCPFGTLCSLLPLAA